MFRKRCPLSQLATREQRWARHLEGSPISLGRAELWAVGRERLGAGSRRPVSAPARVPCRRRPLAHGFQGPCKPRTPHSVPVSLVQLHQAVFLMLTQFSYFRNSFHKQRENKLFFTCVSGFSKY